MKYVIIFWAILCAALLSGCDMRNYCFRKYPPVVHTERTWRDTTIYLSGAVVRDTLNFHTVTENERVITDTSGRAQLRYWRDAYNRLIVRCEALPDTVYIPKAHSAEVRRVEIPVEKTPAWVWYAGVSVLLLAGGVIALRLVR